MSLVATTFNPSDKSSIFTLSNGNLTATNSSGTGTVRATRPCPGNVYFEIATVKRDASRRRFATE